ncbi:hypothetical protein DTO012A7_5308 [Penicillium roqueforti]|uniref:uncharacterized protein n=1 Tax=Penicillium roqueforti TaxID=5082 RepID=UPI00190D230B|nr:uncharacterized protein LCP9604111_352 [Penicillium roqueforti]KAF9252826.1 hypothetical protein LCP9604111_352 [Penicillium roqueforti]KAI2676074.1 hypothetical protein CBS147355_6255 [Penicillium roqueforti]KAI2679239.1 hypothetical protein LCP963914a_7338 [Penicillium roqueforti]KAI2724162.1 hypothetical protein CBS147318_1093 [Penicillium roqueforti]KAI3132930.1 hypothetical protein CBS147330_4114 [Penicillium roqueforti]
MNVILDLQDQAHKLSFSQLKASIAVLASTIQGDQSELPTVAISPLNLSDVQVMLKLKHSLSNLEFRNKPPVGLSPICVIPSFKIYLAPHNRQGWKKAERERTTKRWSNILTCGLYEYKVTTKLPVLPLYLEWSDAVRPTLGVNTGMDQFYTRETR